MANSDSPVADEQDPWSATTQDMFDALQTYRDADRDAVVATIIGVEGSAYRRPGAKMLIDPGNESLGAITAGCLEGPVIDLASEVVNTGTPIVEMFDLMDDEEWGLGLGCNGVIDILLEPLDESWDPILAELGAQRPVATVTAIDTTDERVSLGDRVIVDDDVTVHTPDGRPPLPDTVVAGVRGYVADLESGPGEASVTIETDAGDVTLFIDWLTPPPDLLLFGSQNDVQPVSRVGHEAGFRVTVASARGARSDSDQFPHAHEVKTTRPMDVSIVTESLAVSSDREGGRLKEQERPIHERAGLEL